MDFLVGIVLFLVLGAVVLVPFYLRYLTRAKELDALVKLGEGGADVQVMLAAMMKQQYSPQADKRRGLVLIGVALPVMAFGLFEGEALFLYMLGGIPLLVGFMYLMMARSALAQGPETKN